MTNTRKKRLSIFISVLALGAVLGTTVFASNDTNILLDKIVSQKDKVKDADVIKIDMTTGDVNAIDSDAYDSFAKGEKPDLSQKEQDLLDKVASQKDKVKDADAIKIDMTTGDVTEISRGEADEFFADGNSITIGEDQNGEFTITN